MTEENTLKGKVEKAPLNLTKHIPITNAQAESLLKCIPAGWSLQFSRPLLRPDILQVTIKRPDGIAYSAKTTGGMLLDKKDGDFMEIVFVGVRELMKAKLKAAEDHK